MLMRRLATAAAAAFLALGGLAAPAQAQTGDPSFNLVNRSNRVIYEAYASPSSDSNWGQDRLGNNMVPAGRSFVIRLPQGECIYDVRVVYDRAGGPSEERRNINLCNVTELRLRWPPGAAGRGAAAAGPAAPAGPAAGRRRPDRQPVLQPGEPGAADGDAGLRLAQPPTRTGGRTAWARIPSHRARSMPSACRKAPACMTSASSTTAASRRNAAT